MRLARFIDGVIRGEKCHAAEISNHVRANFRVVPERLELDQPLMATKVGLNVLGEQVFPLYIHLIFFLL